MKCEKSAPPLGAGGGNHLPLFLALKFLLFLFLFVLLFYCFIVLLKGDGLGDNLGDNLDSY